MASDKTRERPILFSGDMVRAILDGRKTQTRRPVKPQPESSGFQGMTWAELGACNKKPFGRIGDRLYVRETWTTTSYNNLCHESDSEVVYKADGQPWEEYEGWRWRPSIHMPRWASRITLEVTGVRVERVQDTSFEDMCAEGLLKWVSSVGRGNLGKIRPDPELPYKEYESPVEQLANELESEMRYCWAALWDSLYAKRGLGWDANPWAWVCEFRQITKGTK